MGICLNSLIIFGLSLVVTVSGTCTLPLSDGTWYSSTRGTWTVAGPRTVNNFKADLSSQTTVATLNCTQQDGTKYVLGTRFEIFFAVYIDVYICLDIRTVTDGNTDSYIYYIVTSTDPATGETFTSDESSACGTTGYETAINAHVLVKDGTQVTAAINFPNVILGNYTVEYQQDSTTVINNTMDSCSDKNLMNFVNFDTSNKLAFTNGGQLYCIYSTVSGDNTYVHTYNNDTSPTGTNLYRFGCWVFKSSGSQVKGSVYPEQCLQDQTSTSVAFGGQTFTFDPVYTCADTTTTTTEAPSSGLAGWIIALIVLGVIAALIIVGIVIILIYIRTSRSSVDEEEGIIKGERQPSPDSIPDDDIVKEKLKAQQAYKQKDGYEEGEPISRKKNKGVKEHTFDLVEVKKEEKKKLQDGNREPSVRDLTSMPPGPTNNMEAPPPGKKHLDPIVFPPGKKPIPPTTPRPAEDDTTLIRIKKERERKEKQREEKKRKEKQAEEQRKKIEQKKVHEPEEKVEQVIKQVRQSSSSGEFETDDSEKEERIKKLMQKRKRLAEASYKPPDGVQDATVVGRKKRRQLQEGEDGGEITKNLMTRDEQEKQNNQRRQRKKVLKKMAKERFRHNPSDAENSDTDDDNGKTRHKRRKAGDPRGVTAPYIQQYYVKKELEEELDEMDFWQERAINNPLPTQDDRVTENKIKAKQVQVAPADSGDEGRTASRLETIMQEEADMWADMGFRLGPNGELPEGFHFDDDGNVVRDIDNKTILSKDLFEKRMEFRRKFGVFSLPRLIRNTDGRPLGGYKDDQFGPTAEWDYGDIPSANEGDDERRQSEAHRPTSGKQVAFGIADDKSVPPTPLNDLDYSTRKGRQLGSAERSLLKARLFDENDKPIIEQTHQSAVPVYFVGKKGGINPDSIYVDNAHVKRQELPLSRSVSQKAARKVPGSNMMARSDTFDDGRINTPQRNSRLRSSRTGREASIPDSITEEPGAEGVPGLSRDRRNIGSDDEFILVPGSMRKLNKPPDNPDINRSVHICPRYERHGNIPGRFETEESDMSMRTVTESRVPQTGKNMKRYLEELYKDKVYFDKYVKTEVLPTNAAVETVDLANQARGFLAGRAEYWHEHQPAPAPPPSELGARISRMRTFYTTADSGMESMMSPTTDRPFSADDAQGGVATSRLQSRENTNLPLQSHRSKSTGNETGNTARAPPTGRSTEPPNPDTIEKDKKEKSVTINETPRDKDKSVPKSPELKHAEKLVSGQPAKNVMSVTDA